MTNDQQQNQAGAANSALTGGSIFERIRHTDDDGAEYWSARELADVLGYDNWRNFVKVVGKAMEACENSGYATSDHMVEADHMVTIGKGGQRKVHDVHLSRYACYLVVQNADPEKEIVALGQTYFTVQTRRAETELTSVEETLAAMSEAQRRLYLRGEVRVHNVTIADAAASVAGVVTARQFAVFSGSRLSWAVQWRDSA